MLQLGRNKKELDIFNSLFVLVIPGRFERPTHSLEGCCSIQLSYGTINRVQNYNFFLSVKDEMNLNEKVININILFPAYSRAAKCLEIK